MKIMYALLALLFTASIAQAACGGWQNGTYTGRFNAQHTNFSHTNTIVVAELRVSGDKCTALVTYTAGPFPGFKGRTDKKRKAVVVGTQLQFKNKSGHQLVYELQQNHTTVAGLWRGNGKKETISLARAG